MSGYREYAIEEYKPHVEPYYLPIGGEVEMFTAAFEERIPVLLKGPTGAARRASSSTWPGASAGR